MASPLALALMQGQGASGVPPPNVAQVAPTNITQATSDYNTAMEQSYQAQLQQQNAMWGGLAGLGAAGILAGGKYLSSPATPGTIAGAVGPTSLGGAPLAGSVGQVAIGGGPIAAADATAGADAVADAGAGAAAAGDGGLDLASLLALFA